MGLEREILWFQNDNNKKTYIIFKCCHYLLLNAYIDQRHMSLFICLRVAEFELFFGISDNWNLFILMIILWSKVYGLLCLGVPISVTEIVLFLLKNSLLLLDIAQTNLATILNSKDNYQCIGSLNSSTGASHAQYIFFSKCLKVYIFYQYQRILRTIC